MDVAVSGSTGLIGSELAKLLEARGDRVVPLVRGAEREGIRWDPEGGTIDARGLEGIDAVVHLAGRPIRAAQWTKRLKHDVRESRALGTQTLAGAIAGLQSPPRVLVSASAVGFYGDRGDEELTEESPSGEGFMAEVCRAWEAATAPAAEAGVRVVRIRSGLVLSRDDGLLPRFLLPFRFGVGVSLGSGAQWMSWIALADEVGAILHLVDHGEASGPFNLTAPNPTRNREFARTIGRVLGRPLVMPVPAFALRLALGRDASSQAALISQRVLPDRLTRTGYEFRHRELEPALRDILGR